MPKDSLAMIELGYNEAKAVVVLTVLIGLKFCLIAKKQIN